jgi:acyl-coenzyme A thioesterase PaaI-like protein
MNVADHCLQETYAPLSTCFGCGPANERGLRIRSRVEGDEIVAEWQPQAHHEAYAGALNGGVIGTLLDCHSNWAAAYHLKQQSGSQSLPSTVTAEYSLRFLHPAPTDGPVRLRARVVESGADRAVVESSLEAHGLVCATFRGTFVAVKPGHPAYHRW